MGPGRELLLSLCSLLLLSLSLEVVEWALDENLKDWTVLWDYGALLALTDCVYKSMMDHGFAYIVDLDEFIVPQVKICF